MEIQVYLDSNIIYGYFLARVGHIKGKTKGFIEPKVIQFLRESLEKTKFFVSVLVKAEIIRILRTELNLSMEESDNVWLEFVGLLNINDLQETVISDEIVDFVRKETFTKSISNILHLFIAKNKKLYFVSGDKEIVDKGKQFYDKTLSYIEFRQLLSRVE